MARIYLGHLVLFLSAIFLIQVLGVRSARTKLIPSEARASIKNRVIILHWRVAKFGDQPVSGAPEPSESSEGSHGAEDPAIRRPDKNQSDKSVAGGGVIIGGLVTAILAAVFCYIRVTRKRNGIL